MHLLLYFKYWKSKLSGIYSTFIGGDISGNPDFLFIAGLEWCWSKSLPRNKAPTASN